VPARVRFTFPDPASVVAGIGFRFLGSDAPYVTDINLETGTVGGNPAERFVPGRFRRKIATRNALLTAYLRGTGPAPRGRYMQYMVRTIDQVRDQMRLRPPTPIESVAWGSSTPSMQLQRAQLFGRLGGRRSARRRRRAKRARRAPRAGVRRARRAKLGRMVKGSPAARRHMAKLRRMRRRRR